MLQSHAFHMSLTAVVGLALFQGVAALVRQEDPLNIWGGVLVASAVVILILPICAVPWVFGGTRAHPLEGEKEEKATPQKVSRRAALAKMEHTCMMVPHRVALLC